jgi:hypothetical protein
MSTPFIITLSLEMDTGSAVTADRADKGYCDRKRATNVADKSEQEKDLGPDLG